ncbi:hypothetical protein HN51_064432, partial [Arachis hypogaea]
MSTVFLHRRRDPFEHGLLPIPKPIFSDPAQTLISLKQKILELSSGGKVDAAVISESLQNSLDHARLVLETLSSVSHLRIPSYPPPKSPSSTCRNCCCSCTFNPTRGSWRAPRRTPSPLVTSGLPPPPSMQVLILVILLMLKRSFDFLFFGAFGVLGFDFGVWVWGLGVR